MANSPLEIPGCPRRLTAVLYLAVTLATSGCLFQKKPRAFVPPTVAPAKPVALKPVPMVDPPPALEAVTTPFEIEGVLLNASNSFPLPPPPAAAAPARPVARTPAPPKTVPPETPQPAQPKIAQILTPQELRDNTRLYDESMARVDRALVDLAKKNLTAADRGTVEQIRSFQAQAKQAKEQDLMTAIGFARRADVLAKDLLGRLP
jgi:hypothetical protein